MDNYQGEESEIFIASLTRSNDNGDIGFMAAPQRLNCLLSRARDGLIIIGNAGTSQAAGKVVKSGVHFSNNSAKRDSFTSASQSSANGTQKRETY